MQERHSNQEQYFTELMETSEGYFKPYLERFVSLDGVSILEIGCGQGGNLYPFYAAGCRVKGLDLDEIKIDAANELFADRENISASYEFSTENFFDMKSDEQFDIILVHDVIEHIFEKELFMNRTRELLKDGGTAFFRFPAWNMPFGGHQQISKSKICAAIPFTHLLPAGLYKRYLKLFKDEEWKIEELLDIKRCRTTIELFERIADRTGFSILDRKLWLINPHYKVKFGLRPMGLPGWLSRIKYLRNFYTTSCFYLLRKKADIKK